MPDLRRGLPSFWVTGLAKLLVGDQPCHLSIWAKGHLKLESGPRSSSFSVWKTSHTTMLTAILADLKAEGWKTTVERYLRVTGQTAILAGKPDVIAQGKEGCRPKIVDAKSG